MLLYLVVSSLINAISTFFLGIIVIGRGRKQKINQAFILIAVSLFVWSLGYYFWRISDSYEQALFWSRVLMLGAIFIAPANLFFIHVFFGSPAKYRKYFYLIFGTAFLFASFSFSPYFVATVEKIPVYGLWPKPGLLYSSFLSIWLAETIVSFVILRRAMGREQDPVRKTQLKYIFMGILVAFLGGYTNFPLWYGINFPPIGNILETFYIGAIALAVLKYKLLNVKVIATEVIIAALLVISFVEITVARTYTEIAVRSASTVASMLFSYFLIRSVRAEVAQREQLQKLTGQLRQTNTDLLMRNRYLAALQALTSEITRSLNFNKFTQDIVDGVAEKLDFVGAVLLLLDKEKETFKVSAITNSQVIKKALAYLPNSLMKYTGNFKEDNNLVTLAMRTGRVQVGAELYSFVSPPIPRGTATIMQGALRMRSIIAVPIFSENSPVGCLLVGSRQTKEKISDTEIQMIKALADEVGIMARNLQLYEQLGKANNRLLQVNEQLSRLDKAKTEFLSIASHQLRTPLTAIKGYVSMILEGDYGKISDKLNEPLKDVFTSAERLISLVNELLDVSRIASGRLELHMQPVNLVSLTENVLEEIKPKAEDKHLQIVLNNQLKNGESVAADSEKVRQVVINLIDNAIKYTDKGTVAINIAPVNKKVRYSVIDSGIGISPEEIPQLFHRFIRAKEAQLVHTQGTGLGLYVAKTIIEAMGGKIWVESDGLGKGSRFIFELDQAPSNYQEKVIKVESQQDYVVN